MKNERELLTVIVPCLDEEENLADTVADILSVAPNLDVEVEIWMVDDGSTDNTAAIMARLEREHAECRHVTNPHNMGIGATVLRCHELIEPDSWITIIPGDNEFVFASIENHLEARERYDFILGYVQNIVIRPVKRRVASAGFHKVMQLLYGFHYKYLNGFLLYRARDVQGLEVTSSGHAFVPELLAKAQLRNPGLRIGEVPFLERGRSAGESKAIRPKSVIQALREVSRGYRSVSEYREEVVRRDNTGGEPR